MVTTRLWTAEPEHGPYAQGTLGVDSVRTHHDTKNVPMIAIDRKFGYVQQPGACRMEKTLAR